MLSITFFTGEGLVIEVSQAKTAINAFRAMLNNYIYQTYLFKSNTMLHVFQICNSQTWFKLEKSYYS